ncbi:MULTISPECIES: thiol peroxidase [Pelosinus]|uniref:Thiol peroxidase n=1 Tax=Pelosinus fermentans B4 TaxID=1149862 RepID=I8REQ0_9FIRM|nr:MULTISPECIES: thiol peroxidase [Pelosinus]EIW17873.1 Redoxin domain protein [Pelosinus fermentans B4]EIW23835.1 thiol peroxidase [Pelosinus fermentans A11]OAM94758.1 thiol peroxidase [Pelosinus fermentans DSM 17108]SDR16909.1 thiol peroxidase (atypical 2-Cys peroxiredoxin) [Pelosinus fermentans]
MTKRNNVVKFGGNPVTLIGTEIKVGDKAPDFTVLNPDLSSLSLKDTQGQVRVISVVPSIDTSVCDIQTRWFNEEAAKIDGLTVLSISVDLPFALKKYCAAQGIDTIKTLSDHRELDFGLKYGFVIEELRLLSRGTVVIDKDDIVRHVEYVANIGDQPHYDQVMAVVKQYL